MGLIIIPGGPDPDPEPEPEAERVVTIAPEEIDGWVRGAIARNRTARRDTRSQQEVDRLVELLHGEGELYLAAALLYLMAFRVAGYEGQALAVLMQFAAEIAAVGALTRRCRACGCTDDAACPGGCEWVEMDLCSRCDRERKEQARRWFSPAAEGPGRDG